MDPTFYYIAGTGLVAIGGAWGGAKVALNGTRHRVKTVEQELSSLKSDTVDRLARVETKIDILLENK